MTDKVALCSLIVIIVLIQQHILIRGAWDVDTNWLFNNTTDDNNNIWNYTSYLPTNKLCYPSIWSQMKGKWNWDNNLNWTSNYNYNSNLDIYNDNQ